MQSFVYPAWFEPGDERGIVVTFPDVPEAITEGDHEAEARVMAEEALALALLSYSKRGLPLPLPREHGGDLIPIIVAPEDAAKLAVLVASGRHRQERSCAPARQRREGGSPDIGPDASDKSLVRWAT